MNCPVCTRPVDMGKDRCNHCGVSIQVYKKIVRISNTLYNSGLEKAKIRDLSGAISDLELSLRYYKYNTDARNLLGLIYYEMGETVTALAQWIRSKNFDKNNDMADYYINSVQSNRVKLDEINHSIKKYNTALELARQGSEDLAIIQLKKVVSQNRKFIKAHQLLALLYISTGQNELAIKCLKKIRSADINNTTTLRYLNELGVCVAASYGTAASADRKVFHGDSNVKVKPVGSYKPETARAFPFINVIIGIIIGLFVGIVLIMPTISGRLNKEKNSEVTDYGERLASQESTISSLQYENDNLKNQISELENTIKELGEDDSLSLAELYDKILSAYIDYNEGSKSKALAAVMDIDESSLESEAAKKILKKIQSEDANTASAEVFEQGRVAYNSGRYEEALTYLTEALNLNKDNYDAIYFMGRLYHKQGDKEKAEQYYRQVIDNYPDSPRASEAESRLSELGIDINNE